MDNVFIYQTITEAEELGEHYHEDVQAKAYFLHYSKVPIYLKANAKDRSIEDSFGDALNIRTEHRLSNVSTMSLGVEKRGIMSYGSLI